jgi:hypothetical protein
MKLSTEISGLISCGPMLFSCISCRRIWMVSGCSNFKSSGLGSSPDRIVLATSVLDSGPKRSEKGGEANGVVDAW